MNYYIKGNAANADQIKAAFEELGYNTGNLEFTSSQLYYTIEGKVELMGTKALQNLVKTHPDYQELPLHKPHYDIKNFHAGMPVLVRDYDNSRWSYVQFSHYIGEECRFKFNACGIPYIQCIPFNDDTKHLLGTTDMCDEQYINW